MAGSLRRQTPNSSPICPNPCSHSHAQIIRTSTLQSNPNRNEPGNDRSVSFRPAGSASYSRRLVYSRSKRNMSAPSTFSLPISQENGFMEALLLPFFFSLFISLPFLYHPWRDTRRMGANVPFLYFTLSLGGIKVVFVFQKFVLDPSPELLELSS